MTEERDNVLGDITERQNLPQEELMSELVK